VTNFAEKIENKLFLRKTFSKLTAQERKVIYLYYFKGKTFKEIGKSLNITESRISQINKKILLTLKKEINDSVMVKAG
jgi:RNA polymerase sigma factor for flagellar operon FliA